MNRCALRLLGWRCVCRRVAWTSTAAWTGPPGELVGQDADEARPSAALLSVAVDHPRLLRPYVRADDATLADDFFGLEQLVTVRELVAARAHYGHKLGTLDERMRWALFGERLGVCVFDARETARQLRLALNFVGHVVRRGGIVLFVGQQREQMAAVERCARECGEFAHARRWVRGTLTNATVMYGGVQVRLPSVIVMPNTRVNVFEQHHAVREAARMLVPVVAVVDSNCDPNLITYPIPANDDSMSAIELYLRLFKHVILSAKDARKAQLVDAAKDAS